MASWIGDILAADNVKVEGIVPSLSGQGISSVKFKAAAENVKETGGVTTDRYGNVQALTEGYVVGGVVPTYIVNYYGTDIGYALAYFAAKHWEELAKPNRYLGAWVEDATLYVDVSEVVPTLRQAIGLALYRKELAIWDNAAGAAIDTVVGAAIIGEGN